MELILITNDVDLAMLAQDSGVDRIMVDLEKIGKLERQGGLNTVISEHSMEDVASIRKVLNNSKLLVRINPIHDNSKEEIDEVIKLGADIVMLPMFKSASDVEKFIAYVNGRAVANLLLETPEALVRIDEILEISGIDEVHVGLNDLHLGMNLDFMFELLSGGIVEYLSNKIVPKKIKFGFGGIARVGKGLLDSRYVLSEHIRLRSSMVILSRDFKAYEENYQEIIDKIDLKNEIGNVRGFITSCLYSSNDKFEDNKKELEKQVKVIVGRKVNGN